MKYLVALALLAVMPALADWRWEGRQQARQAMAEARRARDEARREVAEARREVRRDGIGTS
jgi:Flp pilus assembly protein TadB